MQKKYVFSGRHPKQEKVEAITAVYERGDRGFDIARKLTKLTKAKPAISASAVIAFYSRNRELLKDYPLTERQPQRFKSPEPEMKLRLKQRKPEPSPHAPLPVRTEATIEKPKDELFQSKKIKLLDLEARQCRWGTHETVEDGHLFCGHRTGVMQPYCPHHTKIAQQKTYKEMRADKARALEPAMVPLMIEGPKSNAQAA